MSLCSAFSPAPGGSTFDPANPGEIGGGTPNIGNFTRLNVSPTWNNGAVSFVGIYGRVTNTASGASSKLLDLGTVAEGSLAAINKTGRLQILTNSSAADPALAFGDAAQTGWFSPNDGHMYYGGTSRGVQFGVVPNGVVKLAYNGHIQFTAGAADSETHDAGIFRAAVGVLRVTDAGSGYGTLDVLGLQASGTPGVTFSGAISSITIVNGIVTAAW